MRNGLDYLQYQQYERALKFLRDAEAKQRELSAREVQELKRGIDRAQAGLRAAADATAPYALSDQSRHRNGFTAARPEARTAVAARTGATDAPVRVGARLDRPGQDEAGTVAAANSNTGRAADDAPGEPIRLASAETEVVTPAGAPGAGTGPSPAEAANAAAAADPQSATAEIPALAAPGLPTLTAVPSSPDAAAGAGTPPTVPQDGTTAPATAPSGGSTAQSPRRRSRQPRRRPRPRPLRRPRPDDRPGAHPGGCRPGAHPPGDARFPDVQAGTGAHPGREPGARALCGSLAARALVTGTSGCGTGAHPDSRCRCCAGHGPGHRRARSRGDAAARGRGPGECRGRSERRERGCGARRRAGSRGVDQPPGGRPGHGPAAAPGRRRGAARRGRWHPAPRERRAGSRGVNSTRTGGGRDRPRPRRRSHAGSGDRRIAAVAGRPVPGRRRRTARSDSRGAPLTAASAPAAELPAAAPTPAPPADKAPKPEPIAPAAAPEIPPAVPGVSTPPAETGQPLLPSQEDAPAGSAPSTAVAPAPEPTPAPVADPGSTVPAAPAAADERPIPVPQPEADALAGAATASVAGSTLPSPSAPTGDPAPTSGSSEARFFLPPRVIPPTRLRPFEDGRVTEIMARQEREDVVRNQIQARPQPAPDGTLPREASSSNLQTQTQYDISRAPSPAEARPIKAIPVPEDWVPLAARNWSPQRKYWAAAATCHLPLYFQDAALERYGHPVEQFVGPMGRYLSYPVDDPDQSTQRNQIIQPFFSAGLMALQIAAWPYNAIMDPPWEAQYDLGYYRPGDVVPTDIYWLPLHGYGPPLRGNSY